jgi:tRNA A37 threonylcarbamoyladenosine biosynthesis protein TsaE
VSWNHPPSRGGAPKERERWADWLGEVLGRGKVPKGRLGQGKTTHMLNLERGLGFRWRSNSPTNGALEERGREASRERVS